MAGRCQDIGRGSRNHRWSAQPSPGILLEPVEAAKYDCFRLPYQETWGIVMRKDDPLAKKAALGIEDILHLHLILPRREIVQDNIAAWFGVTRGQLNIFAGHNLLTNAALLVEAGLGYAVCVGGAFEIRRGEHLCFVPFTPERTTGHVLAWKKIVCSTPQRTNSGSLSKRTNLCNHTF